MNNPKFTPGPWHRNIRPVSKYPVVYAGRNTHIAAMLPRGVTPEEAEANCDLVVAGPDLYAALCRARQYVMLALHDAHGKADLVAIATADLAMIDAALASVTGEQPD